MRRAIVLGICFAMSTGYAVADSDPIVSAKTVCRAADAKISTAPCSYSAAEKTVTVSIDLSGQDARELCHTMQISLMQEHVYFDGDPWKLNLKSPFSGGNTIAFCDLPQTPH
jgi:hypothetical protein